MTRGLIRNGWEVRAADWGAPVYSIREQFQRGDFWRAAGGGRFLNAHHFNLPLLGPAPLVAVLEKNVEAGVACPMILDRDSGLIQTFGSRVNLWTGRYHRDCQGADPGSVSRDFVRETEFHPGACMLIRREVLEELGGFDESLFLYYEDVDFGLRVRKAGWKILAIAGSQVVHRDSTADGRRSPVVNFYGTRNALWIVRKYGSIVNMRTTVILSLLWFWPLKILYRLRLGY